MTRVDKKYEEEKIGPWVIARHHNLWYCMGPASYWYHINENTIYKIQKYHLQNTKISNCKIIRWKMLAGPIYGIASDQPAIENINLILYTFHVKYYLQCVQNKKNEKSQNRKWNTLNIEFKCPTYIFQQQFMILDRPIVLLIPENTFHNQQNIL